jgi:hypothetical protein
MPELSACEAIAKLTRAVEGMSPDDLLDFHNELLPRERKSELSAGDAGASDRRKILDYFGRGLEIEEILDLWNVAFPETYNVHFDDESARDGSPSLSRGHGTGKSNRRPRRTVVGDDADRTDAPQRFHPQSNKRLFGITRAAYQALDPAGKDAARKSAQEQMGERYGSIFQRRHDCIHNCDRPKVSPQPLVKGDTVIRVIEDVEFLVSRCDEHINAEFRQFLLDANCPAAIIGQAGY